MKKLLFIAALALLSIPAFSQRDPGIVQDSVSTFTRNDTVFQRIYVKYANGKESLVIEPLGDSSTVLNAAFNGIVEQSRIFHANVVVTMQRNVVLKNFRDLNTVYNQYSGGAGDAFRAIAARFYTVLVDTASTVVNYNYIAGGITTPIRIDFQNNGNIRVRDLPGTATTTIRMYSDKMIRINNYPANSETFLFWWQPDPTKLGVWRSQDNLITLRRRENTR